MRLIIREYLSLLRESGELDALLPDLLLSMGIVPTSKPEIGSRQYGVDIAAVGEDPLDNVRKLFLITVKMGHITRGAWNGSEQAVRQSLDEILDTYLTSMVADEHKNLPVKIVLCCNGEMRQTVQPNWRGYVKRHSEDGKLEFAFWGGDETASLLEEYLVDEWVSPAFVDTKLSSD